MKASVKYATQRFIEWTGLVIVLALGFGFANTLGTATFSTVGEALQERFFPPMADMSVYVPNPSTGVMEKKVMPAFEVKDQQWVGRDLLLTSGTFCKAADYSFEKAQVAFGTPDSIIQPSDIEFMSPASKTGRPVGCQEWRNWLIIGAGDTPLKEWFLTVTFTPKHKLWPVRQTLGPFKLPDRSILKAG